MRRLFYIDSAFAIANALAPDIKQMINQHGDFEAVVWEKMKELIAYLRSKGRRIDGIGWQAHIDMGWEKVPGNLTRLSNFIDWCHSNNLAFHITEFNVWLRDGNEGKLDEQAETFATLVRLLKDKSSMGPTGVNFWQISCKDAQHADRDGSIWDINHAAKPAYEAIRSALLPSSSSVKEVSRSLMRFKLMPNPANEIVYIQSEKMNEQYHIFSLDGKNVMSGQVQENGGVDISILPKGYYLVKIGNAPGMPLLVE